MFCEICGSRYNLDSRKGCYCNGADKRNSTICTAQKVGLKELSRLTYGTLIVALSEPETIMEQAQKNHHKWEEERTSIEELNQKKEDREKRREQRRRLLSFQHEQEGITNEEYIKRLDDIKKEGEKESDGIFELPPEPPTPEEIERTYDILTYFKPYRLHFDEVLRNPQDKWAEELAEMVGLKVIIGPPLHDKPDTKYTAYISTNLPFLKKKEELREELWKCADCNYTYMTLASDPDDSCPNCSANKLVPQWGDNKPTPFPDEVNPKAMVFSSSVQCTHQKVQGYGFKNRTFLY